MSTLRRTSFFVSALLGALLFVACAREGDKNRTENEPSDTKAVWETGDPLPTEDWSELIAKNRELHALVKPKNEVSAVGTGPARTEEELEACSYGVDRANPLRMISGKMLEWDATPKEKALWGRNTDYAETTYFEGLADPAVMARINNRIDEIAEAVSSPWYYPDVSGIVSILREKGQPGCNVYVMQSCNCDNVLSVEICRIWTWYSMDSVYHPSVIREADERWASGDGRFSVSYQEVDDGETGRMMACICHEIRETIGVNFSLVSGEELRLSDLFEEGEDYLAILNDGISRALRNDFWFDDAKYQSTGEYDGQYGKKYAESREYDGGRAFTGLTGDEAFVLQGYGNGVSVCFPGLFNGHDVTVQLPKAIPAGNTEGIYKYQQEFTFEPLGRVYFGSTMTVSGEKIGSVVVPSGDADTISADVWRGTGAFTYSSAFGTVEEPVRQMFSDEAMLHCAEQSLSERSKTERVSNCSLAFVSAEVYPNGFVRWCWEICNSGLTEGALHYLGTGDLAEVWTRDGEVIPDEEIFDVPYEELLREMLSALLWRWEPMLSEAEVSETVTLLLPYLEKIKYDAVLSTEYSEASSFGGVKIRWPGRSEADTWGMMYPSAMPPGIKENVSEKFWNFMCFDSYAETVVLSDPFVLLRHLRMYEGYHFPQYDAKQRMPRER